jgi:hypothetical protein
MHMRYKAGTRRERGAARRCYAPPPAARRLILMPPSLSLTPGARDYDSAFVCYSSPSSLFVSSPDTAEDICHAIRAASPPPPFFTLAAATYSSPDAALRRLSTLFLPTPPRCRHCRHAAASLPLIFRHAAAAAAAAPILRMPRRSMPPPPSPPPSPFHASFAA